MAAPGPGGPGIEGAEGIVTKESPRPFDDTVARLLDLLGSKGLKVFAVIDQQAEAHAVGLELRPPRWSSSEILRRARG